MKKRIYILIIIVLSFVINTNVFAKSMGQTIKENNPKLYNALLEVPYLDYEYGEADGIISDYEIYEFNGDMYLANKGLDSIEGLEYFDSVTNVWLEQNDISDITPLFGMDSLQYVSIQANRINESYLRDHSSLNQVKQLSEKINDGFRYGLQQIDYDASKITSNSKKYKVLFVILKDINAVAQTIEGTNVLTRYTMTDTDIELIREWARLFEMYVEKLSDYNVDIDLDIYVTKNTYTEFSEPGMNANGGYDYSIMGKDIPEIASILEDYDTSIVTAYINSELHSYGGLGGFDGNIQRGNACIAYDTYVDSGMSLETELNFLKQNKSINYGVDTYIHEFLHTLEQYSENRGFPTWEYHDNQRLRNDQYYKGMNLNFEDNFDVDALYIRGYSNPNNDSEKGIIDELWTNTPTKYNTTTLTAPNATTVSISVDDDKEQITLSWNAVSNTTVYKLLRSTKIDGIYDIVYFGTNRSYIDKNMELGTTYYYKVIAVNSSGVESIRSANSNIVSGKVAAKEITEAPVVIMGKGNNNSLSLTWQDVEGAKTYRVYRSDTINGTYTRIAAGLKTTNYIDEGLEYGKTYYYKVTAIGLLNQMISEPVGRKVILNTVTGLKATPGDKQVTLSWNATEADGYEIYTSTDNSTFTKVATTTKTNYTVKNLTKNTVLYYKVRAYKTISSKVYGNYSSVVRTRTAPGTPVVSLTASPLQINITIKALSGAQKYYIYKSESKDGPYSRLVILTEAGTYVDNNVVPSKTYYYKVRTANGYNALSAFTDSKSVTTTIPIPNVRHSESASSATFSWTLLDGITGYQIYKAEGTNSYKFLVARTGRSYKDNGLTPGVTYSYRVRAFIKIGNTMYYGPFSPVIQITPTISKVSNLTTTKVSNGIKLSWDSISGITNYQIFRSEDNTTYTKLATLADNTYIDKTAQIGKTYYYKVRAYVKIETLYYGKFSTPVSITNK